MSPTSKPSKPSEPECEWVLPSGLSKGDLVTLVHARVGSQVSGRVIGADPGLGCRIRPVDEHGVTLAKDHEYYPDKFYTVRIRNGHEMH